MKSNGKLIFTQWSCALVFLMSILFAGCIQEITEDVPVVDETPMVVHKLKVGFADAQTRTYVENGRHLRWHQEDMLSAFVGNATNLKYVFDGSTGDPVGTFSLAPDAVPSSGSDFGSIRAVYPYDPDASMTSDGTVSLCLPSTQNYAENSFGREANVMITVSETLDDEILYFKNLCGYLKLKLYSDGELLLTSVMVKGNADEKIAGPAEVSMSYGGDPVLKMSADAEECIVLDCGAGIKLGTSQDEATEMWLVVPAVKFEKGITMILTDSEGNVYEKTTANAFDVKRNMITPMKALKVTPAMMKADDGKPSMTEIWYTSSDGNIVTPVAGTMGAELISNTYHDGKGVMRFDRMLKRVGEGAFEQKRNLDSVTLPEGVTEIGLRAFRYSGLDHAYLPDGLKVIGERAFIYCSLDEILIPETVTEIGMQAFDSNGSLESVYVPNGVKTLGRMAFYGCSKLKEVVLGTGLEEIPMQAFAECPLLADVTIPSNIKSIGVDAFYNCKSMTSVDLSYVETVGSRAFASCTGLQSVTLGKNLTAIGYGAFDYCTGKLIVHCNVPDALSECRGLFTEVVIGDEVTSVGKGFTGMNLNKLYMGKNVRYVAQNAFNTVARVDISDLDAWCKIEFASIGSNPTYSAKKLYLNGSLVTKVTIPSDVSYVGNYQFVNCADLQTVQLHGSIKEIGSSAFRGCTYLQEIDIPYGVEAVGTDAFYDCKSLSKVTLPGSLKSIEANTFRRCASLASISVPSSVISIGDAAFSGCSNLSSITFGSGLSVIGDDAFSGCAHVSISLPSSVKKIGYYAFHNQKLVTVYSYAPVPPAIVEDDDEWDAFSSSSSLKIYVPMESVDLYKTVWKEYASHIVGDASYQTSETTTFNYSTTNGAALSLSGLPVKSNTYDGGQGELVVYGKLTYVPSSIFKGKTTLKSITIPDNVRSIESRAFEGCTALETIYIPDNIKEIGSYAFYKCSSLKSVYCKSSVPPTGANKMFDNNASDRKIYVPSGSAAAYKGAAYWSKYADSIVEDEGISLDFLIDGVNMGKGVEIDGLVWAPVNTGSYMSHYGAETKGCPEGWRLPTMKELLSLSVNRSSFAGGYYFSGSKAYAEGVPCVWFTASGREYLGEDADDSVVQYKGSEGYYWSSEMVGAYGAYALVFDRDGVRQEGLNAFEYYSSVRCVADLK